MTSAAAASSADPATSEADENSHHTVTIEIPQHAIQNGSVDVSMDSPGSQTSSSSEGPEGSAAAAAVAAAAVAGATAQASQVTTQVVVADSGVVTADCASPHFITVTATGSRSYTSLTPVNPVVSDGDPTQADVVTGGVHPTYVQYVEGSPEQAIYTATNGQMAYPVYTVGEATGTMYTSATAQYYPNNSTAVTYSQVANSLTQGASQSSPGSAAAAQLLAQSTAGYLIQQGVDAESAAHTLIASHRGASPPTVSAVQWLLENYETAEGVSLPRSTLYNHYQRHCNEHKLDPVNAASFGKLIRSVFLGLRTRRLGTRGNSKYHYYGIRVKPGSSLNQLGEDGNSPLSGRGSVGPQTTPGGSATSSQRRYKFLGAKSEPTGGQYEQSNTNPTHSSGQINCSPSQNSHHHQYLGDGVGAIPEFPEIALTSELALPEDCTFEDVDTLRSIYREHCEAFLDAVITLEFQTVESVWREFWRSQDNNNGEECEEEKYLSKTKLYQLCKCEPVQQFIRHVDYLFYQNLVEVLIPDVLRPIPSTLTQAIRNFAKGLESWLTSAMQGCPQEMMELKVCAVSSFAQTLRRYTSLNHLAQAARAVLQNSAQINQMLVDLNRVDFHNVQEQASWVCQCDDGVVQRLEEDFKVTLQQQNSLEQWAAWLKGVVTQVLKPYQGKPNFAKAARQFLLKWSFYSSMVIRDLTLRSAASFGSFHLIRLLYDEYMFFLIEHQVAQETGETPIAVMGEKLPTSTTSLFPPETLNGNSPSSSITIKSELNHAKRLKIS